MAGRQQDLADGSGDQKSPDQSGGTEEGRRKQESLRDETQAAAEQSAGSAAQEALDEALKEQQAALDAMERGEDASAAQRRAAEALRRAADVSDETGEDGSAAVAEPPEDGESRGTEENPEDLPYDLQSMLNAEQDRRKNEQTPDDRIMVEKNW
jgi:ribosomal protein S11